MNFRFYLVSLFCLCFTTMAVAQVSSNVLEQTNVTNLQELAQNWKIEYEININEARIEAQKRNLLLRESNDNGEIIEIKGITERGELIYYTTGNLDAARTTSTDDVWPGGSLGFTLSGDSMIVGEWDGGAVRASHYELTGRVTQVDNASSVADHPTHVAGTLIGSGVDPSAKGMAHTATLNAYDWNNDNSEMATAASNGLLVSNHSYSTITGWRYNSGASRWEWWGDTTLSATEDYKFGVYNSSAQAWDLIARNAPYYLIMKSAGNDRGSNGSSLHYLPLHSAWSTTTRLPDGGTSGYDCISTAGCAKNILTVGAVDAIPGGYSNPASVVMSSFSGWGPTDDGRIKPDIVGNGVGVYSSLATNDSAYTSWNGTSMSSPAVTGSLALIQQHYKNEKGVFMKAATLKGLAIHTADEAGSANGPDYQYGWGLLNTAKAVQHISDTSNAKDIVEASILNGQTNTYSFTSTGTSAIRATICWTDVPGTPSNSLNSTSLKLVNDLDIRVIRLSDSSIYTPYILNPASPNSGATTGDNFRDNVEQVYIQSPITGDYSVVISHKGTISGGSVQNFSLLLDGGSVPPPPFICDTMVSSFPAEENWDAYTNCSATSSAMCPLPLISGFVNDLTDDIDWKIYSGATTSSATGPSADTTNPPSGKYIYTESSTNGTGFPNKTAVLYSPCYDLDSLVQPELSFAYHMYGVDMGSLTIEVYDGIAWTQVWALSGNQGNSWVPVAVDLSAYADDTIQLKFTGITGSNFHSDIALDAITIREFVPCSDPSNLAISNVTDSSAVFSWNSTSIYSNIRLDFHNGANIIPPSTINFNPVLFFNLLSNTSYDIYVQDSCSSGDTSAWIGPFTFTTTGVMMNPTNCGLNIPIPELGCLNMTSFPISVVAPGNSMGNDVFLNEVKLIIEHTWDADLWIKLQSPSGDTVELSKYRGVFFNNYGNPLDTSCSQTTNFTRKNADPPISAGSAPFIGSYLPEDALSDFDNLSNPNGTWNLLICDNFLADSGFVHYLELVFDTVASDTACEFGLVNISLDDGYQVACPGNEANISAVFSGQNHPSYTYQWIKDGQNLLSSDSLFYYDASTPGSYNVIVRDTNGCIDSAVVSFPFSNHALPIVIIYNAGSDSMCLGDSTLLYTDPFASTQWYQNGVGFGNPFSQQQYIHDSALYNVYVTDTNGCQDSAMASYQITLVDDPIVVITGVGPTTVCTGDSALLVTDGGDSYQWSRSGIPVAGGNNDSLYVTVSGSYNVLVTNSTGCEGTSAIPKGVIILTPANIPITNSGQASFCGGDSTILSVPGGNSFQWLKDGHALPGDTNRFLTVLESGNYNIMVEGENCFDTSFVGELVTVYDLPNAQILNSGNDTICTGDSVVFTASPIASNYAWFRDGTIIVAGPTYNQITVSDSGIYDMMLLDSNLCRDSAIAVQITKFDYPVVTISTSDATSFCDGGEAVLHANGGIYYQWIKNGVIIAGANQDSLVVNSNGNYNVLSGNVASCEDSASTGIQITVNLLPTVGISNMGSSTFCSGDSTLLQTAPSNSYQWLENGNIISGAISNQLVVGTTGLYNVLVEDANLCSDTSISPVIITVNSLPNVSITNFGNDSICEGEATLLYAGIGSSFQWYKNGQVISGSVSDTLIINQTGSYNVVMTDPNTCSDSATLAVQIEKLSLPVVNVSNSGLIFCDGDTGNLIATSGFSQYQWYRNGQVIPLGNSSQYLPTSGGNYNVVVTDQYTCKDSAGTGTAMLFNPLPSVNISASGPTTLCDGDSVNLSVPAGNSYQWFKDGTTISSATSNSYLVNSTGSFNVFVTDGNTCSDSSLSGNQVTVNTVPIVTVSASGNTTFCSDDSVQLSVNPGQNYQWYHNGLQLAAVTANSIYVNLSGNYNVMVTNANNCSDSSASGQSVTVNALPSVTITPSGSTTFCDGDSVSLSVPSGNNYQWYSNGTAISSATSNSIGVFNSASYNVLVTDGNSCADSAQVGQIVVVNDLPNGQIAASQVSFCDGDSALLTCSNPGQNYQWTKSGQAFASNQQSVYVSAKGFYNVLMTNSNQCSDSASSGITIDVFDLPIVNFDSLPESCQYTEPFLLNQGSPTNLQAVYTGLGVTGSVGVFYFDPTVAGVGSHTLWYVYSDNNQCSDSASQVAIVNLCQGIGNVGGSGFVKIYPNPSNGELRIDLVDEQTGHYFITIFDASGKLVHREEGEKDSETESVKLDLRQVSKGIYFVQLQLSDKVWTQKLILE